MPEPEQAKTPTPPSPNLREAALRLMLDVWGSLPALARSLHALNVWLAQKFGISPEWSGRFFKIEVGVLLGGGATMIQLGEYAFAVVFWIILAMIWVSKILDWRTIGGGPRRIAIVKGINIVMALAIVATMIVWTNIKRDEQDWTALQKLFTHNRLRVLTVATDKKYVTGTVIEGILWQPYYTELDVVINNPTDASYEDVNILIRPDYPVAKIAQMSNLSDVSFEDKDGLTMRTTIEEQPTPNSPWSPALVFSFVATNAGYKVHCGRIPPDSSLKLVLALVDMKKSNVFSHGVVPPNVNIRDFSSELNFQPGGESYWFSADVTNPVIYASRPTPKTLTVEGGYLADSKRQRFKQKVPIMWRNGPT